MRALQTQRRGRPLVFLGMVVLGWTGLRMAMGSIDPAEPQSLSSAGLVGEINEAGHAPGFDGMTIDADSAATETAALDMAQNAVTDGQAAPLDEPPLTSQLDAPPPAHLVADPIPLPAASIHNSLWMSASQAEPMLPAGDAFETTPQEEGN